MTGTLSAKHIQFKCIGHDLDVWDVMQLLRTFNIKHSISIQQNVTKFLQVQNSRFFYKLIAVEKPVANRSCYKWTG